MATTLQERVRRQGVKRRRSYIFAKEPKGHYVEPAWVSRRLFEVEKFSGFICDPACGWGVIVKEARSAGYATIGNDIVDRRRHHLTLGKSFSKGDFLTWRDHPLFHGNVVCNPPFDHVRDFCEQSVRLGARKVAMICLVRRLNAAHWLQQLPLRRIWLLSPRPSMPPGSLIAKGHKPRGGMQDFCWLVFEREYVGPITVGWLCRDEVHNGVRQRRRS